MEWLHDVVRRHYQNSGDPRMPAAYLCLTLSQHLPWANIIRFYFDSFWPQSSGMYSTSRSTIQSALAWQPRGTAWLDFLGSWKDVAAFCPSCCTSDFNFTLVKKWATHLWILPIPKVGGTSHCSWWSWNDLYWKPPQAFSDVFSVSLKQDHCFTAFTSYTQGCTKYWWCLCGKY